MTFAAEQRTLVLCSVAPRGRLSFGNVILTLIFTFGLRVKAT
uniref:Uncharacterized protein n=1 Tax=Anguilla anguilla TaxID=7936 RepID=A0A0E9PAE0_ANGAN